MMSPLECDYPLLSKSLNPIGLHVFICELGASAQAWEGGMNDMCKALAMVAGTQHVLRITASVQ